jgi:SPP1 gp7 family putative phage head morphogenesis protein
MKEKILPPIKEGSEDFERLEVMIRELFKKSIYIPLLKELGLGSAALKNAADDLLKAIQSGRITFYRGEFKGRFGAQVSGEFRRLGAKWDRRQGSWRIPLASLPIDIRMAISAAENKMKERLRAIDRKLQQFLPEEIADKLKAEKLFDTTLWRLDRDFEKTVKGITVSPKLSKDARMKIAEGYTQDLRRYIKDWTEEEILELRKKMQTRVPTGVRYEQTAKMIQKSFGVAERKAKFLARQETALMMAKFKEVRYAEAGVNEYIWTCVKGSPGHPVRPMHKALDGTRHKWNNPPVTSSDGKRNNPGQDYNCRCYARPVVKFK